MTALTFCLLLSPIPYKTFVLAQLGSCFWAATTPTAAPSPRSLRRRRTPPPPPPSRRPAAAALRRASSSWRCAACPSGPRSRRSCAGSRRREQSKGRAAEAFFNMRVTKMESAERDVPVCNGYQINFFNSKTCLTLLFGPEASELIKAISFLLLQSVMLGHFVSRTVDFLLSAVFFRNWLKSSFPSFPLSASGARVVLNAEGRPSGNAEAFFDSKEEAEKGMTRNKDYLGTRDGGSSCQMSPCRPCKVRRAFELFPLDIVRELAFNSLASFFMILFLHRRRRHT